MKPQFDWMWIWWVPTVIICVWKLVEALLRPARMLEWPFFACAMWIYFYGYMAFEAKVNLSAYLAKGMADIGQLMALLCLIGLLAGWSLGKRVRVRVPRQPQSYPYLLAWVAGMFFLTLGAAGAYSVGHAQDEGQLNYQTGSGYWILLFYVGYPGLAIALWSALKMKSSGRYFVWFMTAVGLVAFLLPHMMSARRGPLFPAIILLLLVPPLTWRRPPNRLVYAGGLLVAGLVMLLFLQVRVFIYNGGTWGDALQHLSLSTAVVERAEEADDNEYINCCQNIATVWNNGKYQYGTGHLEMFVHWVPRAIWKGKPTIGEGTYSFDEMWDDMEAYTGVHLMGNGAAVSGVADSFVQYGIFCPLFWFGLSYGIGVIYAKVLRTKSPWWLFAYVGFICGSDWLVSQNFTAAFVPCMYFEFIPLVVWLLLWVHRQLTAAPHKMGAPGRPTAMPGRVQPALPS